ncbi:efflux transporter outer membrane subunit [Sphingobium algorifonticola]|uniref:Efflux transporter outer membrane subunit n=1 Tax=Sphingobium algorifonticola TaxID=2008318 RepID=A0A437J4A7_9SPHN|nr:efflux transporter outer membrane subunit [Sphingobium algorifonticola]RVT39455.1 efflux transporter outer membrane subunit [Sphingobium algorifonticola]
MKRMALTLVMLAAGCSMAPKYVQPVAPVPASWPVGDAYLAQSEAALPRLSYRDIFTDGRLQQIVEQALVNNRDIRIAAANIATARAQYRINRANILPEIAASAGYTYSESNNAGGSTGGTGFSSSGSRYTADLGTTAFELDLFGRLRSLSDAALQRYFATEAAARATRLTLVGDIADAWLTYAADQSLLAIARDTVISAERSVRLTRMRLEGGIAPRTDLRQAEQILATARADVALQTTALAQDVNALQLLVGAPVDPALLPQSMEDAAAGVRALPAGLDSGILLRRPDVVQAEYELRAANAEIGAARAALFPRISLTGLASLASTALSSLFTGGAFSWSAGADASYSIFSAGGLRAGLAQSKAQRDAALATYEKAIQSAFRDVADGLARRGTIADQLAANRAQAEAAADSYRLTDARYRGGIDSFLASLDAQRSLYSAQRGYVGTQLVGASNLVSLYRALGGDMLLSADGASSADAVRP